MFHVLIMNSRPVAKNALIFEGKAFSVCLPGKDGEFEILDFHKPIISRLKKGIILVDNETEYPVQGGVVKMNHQSLVAVVDI